MRKIIANGKGLTTNGQCYLILEQLEDETIIELMNEPIIEGKEYPRLSDINARVSIVNEIKESLNEPVLTQEEIDFMISYRPGDII